MQKTPIHLTTAQFANLHEINKRTLHYYDSIGLFSPLTKGENGYRYYDLSQSVDFEYIRMLKELNMSIEEIRCYFQNPSPEKFLEIADTKETEINREIRKLKRIKKILQTRKQQLHFCENLNVQEVRIEECPAEKLLFLPYTFTEDDISQLFSYVRNTWSLKQICMGIGSFISLDKVKNRNFEKYDGLYTPALDSSSSAQTLEKPQARYLCGYQKGSWDMLPAIYERMLNYAQEHQLQLTGYAYEIGLNEFAISRPEEYITKIMIQIV